MSEFTKDMEKFFGSSSDKTKEKIEPEDGMSEETRKELEEDLKKFREKRANSPISQLLTTVGIGVAATGLLGSLMFGGKKMFGSTEHSFKEYIIAVIDGFIGYIEVLRHEIKELKQKLEQEKEKTEMHKRHYDDALSLMEKQKTESTSWKSKYMKMVSKCRKKPVKKTKKAAKKKK